MVYNGLLKYQRPVFAILRYQFWRLSNQAVRDIRQWSVRVVAAGRIDRWGWLMSILRAIWVIVPLSTVVVTIAMAITVTIPVSVVTDRWVVVYYMNLFCIFWSGWLWRLACRVVSGSWWWCTRWWIFWRWRWWVFWRLCWWGSFRWWWICHVRGWCLFCWLTR